ncbi:hypothetical protein A6A03_06490 [Chloroflexus islandicus]|uniref:Uncharacterized protein n=1 Tax=Chloroflexus islandicus TaxID=1707952 RepID=A0A178MMD8_9CHLR|nr:hypothetical protein [Chloroflexus islandicus]OAN49703.1 hypothetical protein A6A03_06490 [Chloroflexus islandicus]
MRIVCVNWICCLLGLLSSIAIFPAVRAIPDHRVRHGPIFPQSFHLPTTIIRNVIAAVDQNDPLELAAFAAQMESPGSLNLLIAAWQHAHRPASFVLGPYRLPDWPAPGAQLAIPLRFACPHGESRLDVIVTFTVLGWQVSEIRPPV